MMFLTFAEDVMWGNRGRQQRGEPLRQETGANTNRAGAWLRRLAVWLACLVSPLWFSTGCVFFQLKDALEKTGAGLAQTNIELSKASQAIVGTNEALQLGAVPAMKQTVEMMRETKGSLEASAALKEPMGAMNEELVKMRTEMASLRGQLAQMAALGPTMQRVGELRGPMQDVAGLSAVMGRVSELREPMQGLQGLRDPMMNVAQLREPLTTTGLLVEPMRELAAQAKSVEPQTVKNSMLWVVLGGILLSMLTTAAGVWLGMRLAIGALRAAMTGQAIPQHRSDG